jgi:putative FmdB family regulatory protein
MVLGEPAGRVAYVPRYEYRCRACGDTFELNRPMTESSAPCTCPQGHDDTVKLLSIVSVGGLASGRSAGRPSSGGGCCGGACGCG